MCIFFSAIVNDEGKVFWKNGISSHSEIETACDIRDDGHHAKVELVPSGDFSNVDTWVFNIDEERKPDWWDGAYEGNVRQVVKEWMASGKNYTWTGRLDLRGVTKLDPGVVFPEKTGWLDLRGVTKLDPGVVFPKEVTGGLDLRGVTKLDPGVVFPEKTGRLDLRGVTKLPRGLILPKTAYIPNVKEKD